MGSVARTNRVCIDSKPPIGRPGTMGGDAVAALSTNVCKSAVRRYGIEDTIPSVSLDTFFCIESSNTRSLK